MPLLFSLNSHIYSHNHNTILNGCDFGLQLKIKSAVDHHEKYQLNCNSRRANKCYELVTSADNTVMVILKKLLKKITSTQITNAVVILLNIPDWNFLRSFLEIWLNFQILLMLVGIFSMPIIRHCVWQNISLPWFENSNLEKKIVVVVHILYIVFLVLFQKWNQMAASHSSGGRKDL